MRESRELRTGKLLIGAVGPFHLMEMVSAFRHRHPKIEVSIGIGNSEQTLRGLLAPMAFRGDASGLSLRTSLSVQVVCANRHVVGNGLAGSSPVSHGWHTNQLEEL
jgi:DNA-binding transcriptional LysR family regulator